MKRIRVLHAIDHLWVGGAQSVLVGSLELLDRSRFDVEVLTFGSREMDLQRQVASRCDALHVLEYLPVWDLRQTLRIARIIERRRIDVVHAHLLCAAWHAGLAARLTGRSLFVTAHNVAGDRSQHGHVVRRAGTIAERWLANVVFAVSGGVRETYVEELGLPRRRVQLLENIPLAPFLLRDGFDPRAKRNELELRDPIVCCASRLTEVRDHATLIRALPRLVERLPTLDVVLLGEGDQEPTIRRLVADLGLERNVHLLGTRLDAVEIMAASDVFVQPTFYEGMSIAVLDAMSLGRPVVGSDVEGLRGLIEAGRTGYLVPPGDAPAMETALMTLLTEPDVRDRIGSAARAWIARELPADRWIARQEALYEAWASERVKGRERG